MNRLPERPFNKKFTAGIVISLLISLLTFMSGYGQLLQAEANQRPSAREIPDKTLIIGTHLIAFEALNQEILDLALRSVDELMKKDDEIVQDKVFYKSDLNRGVWYDITNATSLVDITVSSRNAVADSVIDGLVLTHWTKRDGITIELGTGKQVSLQEIDSPANPEMLSELDLLKMVKEIQEGKLKALLEELAKNGGDSGRDLDKQIEDTKAKIALLDKIFQPVEDSFIDEMNKLLDGYDAIIQQLINQKTSSDRLINMTAEQKAIARAERDAFIFDKLIERINEATEIASMLEDGEFLSRLGTTLNELHQALIKAEARSDRAKPDQVLDKMADEFSQEMRKSAASGNVNKAIEDLLKVLAIDSLYNNRILDKELELKIIGLAMEQVSSSLQGQGTAKVLREMEDLLKFYQLRVDPEAYAKMLEDWLNKLRAMQGSDQVRDSIDKYAKELARLKAEASPEVAKSMSDLERLSNLMATLQEQYFTAAERGDSVALQQIKDQLDSANSLLQARQDQAAQDYKNLLERQNSLANRLAGATNANDKKLIQDELDQLMVQMAGLENILDGKNLIGLQNLDQLKQDLKNALSRDDMTTADKVAQGLVDLLSVLPDNLMSNQQKQSELEQALEQVKAKANQYVERAMNGAADNMTALAQNIEQLASDRGVGTSRTTVQPPLLPRPYTLVFEDLGVRLREPIIERNKTKYVEARPIFEALGSQILWQEERQRIVIQDRRYTMLLEYAVNSDIVYVNNRRMRLQEPIESIYGRTWIPLEVILDAYRMTSETGNETIYARSR
ncbi:copper amine oxidase N-terminal domain-containing protein [Heliorestis acidaminivorans]|nr:copper amine oxidase N-terminal domain-containing protein [Heliorestis acidaminivorans]